METLYHTLAPYKSRGEKAIADCLTRAGVQFEYEKPLLIPNRDRLRLWYPDFSLPKESVLIEYFGLEGDPDYDKGIVKKLSAYRENHLDVIDIYPNDLHEANWGANLLNRVDRILEYRLKDFRHRVRNNQTGYMASGGYRDL